MLHALAILKKKAPPNAASYDDRQLQPRTVFSVFSETAARNLLSLTSSCSDYSHLVIGNFFPLLVHEIWPLAHKCVKKHRVPKCKYHLLQVKEMFFPCRRGSGGDDIKRNRMYVHTHVKVAENFLSHDLDYASCDNDSNPNPIPI